MYPKSRPKTKQNFDPYEAGKNNLILKMLIKVWLTMVSHYCFGILFLFVHHYGQAVEKLATWLPVSFLEHVTH